MLLYFKPGSHPWDTRIQVGGCSQLVSHTMGGLHLSHKIVVLCGHKDHERPPWQWLQWRSFCLSRWLTRCQCERWKWLPEDLSGKRWKSKSIGFIANQVSVALVKPRVMLFLLSSFLTTEPDSRCENYMFCKPRGLTLRSSYALRIISDSGTIEVQVRNNIALITKLIIFNFWTELKMRPELPLSRVLLCNKRFTIFLTPGIHFSYVCCACILLAHEFNK